LTDSILVAVVVVICEVEEEQLLMKDSSLQEENSTKNFSVLCVLLIDANLLVRCVNVYAREPELKGKKKKRVND
jgi:hypothetical protein